MKFHAYQFENIKLVFLIFTLIDIKLQSMDTKLIQGIIIIIITVKIQLVLTSLVKPVKCSIDGMNNVSGYTCLYTSIYTGIYTPVYIHRYIYTGMTAQVYPS